MTKSELVQKLCNTYPNILHEDIEKIVDIIIFEIIKALCRNEAIEIRRFGRFKTVMRKARMGRNPKNFKTLSIPAKKAIKWKTSKTLFSRLNKNFTENKISATY